MQNTIREQLALLQCSNGGAHNLPGRCLQHHPSSPSLLPLLASSPAQVGEQQCGKHPHVCLASEWSALRSQCLPSPGTPALLPSADPSQGVLAIDKALAAGRISREASVALGLNEIHFQKSPGSPCRKGSPEDFERKRRCTSLALQEQSSAGKEKGELSPGHTRVRAAFCSICGTDI